MKTNSPKIVVAGYYGYGNLGDELILKVILAQFRRKYSSSEIVILSGFPSRTRKTHQVQAISRWNPISVVYSFFRSDLFVLGGGGLFQDKTSLLSLGYYLALIGLARVFNLTISLFAIGVESVRRPIGKKWMKKILLDDHVNITVRDVESKLILGSLGIPEKKIFVTGDPVFCLDVPTPSRPGDEEVSTEKGGSRVLFVPRFPCSSQGHRLYADVLKEIRSEAGANLQGMLFQTRKERKHIKSMPASVAWQKELFSDITGLENLFQLIREVDLVVSARFHGLVLAALCDKPFVGLGDADKVGRLCLAWGMPHLAWDATPEEVKDALVQVSSPTLLKRKRPLELWKQASFLTVDLTDSWLKTAKKS